MCSCGLALSQGLLFVQEAANQDITTLVAAGREQIVALFALMDEVDLLKPPLIAANVLGKEFLDASEAEGVVTALAAYETHAADLATAYAAADTYTANLKKRLLEVRARFQKCGARAPHAPT